MDLQDRLKQLENVRDWQGLVEELEKGIQSQTANEAKASFHIAIRFNPSYPTVERPNIFHPGYIGRELASDHIRETFNKLLPRER